MTSGDMSPDAILKYWQRAVKEKVRDYALAYNRFPMQAFEVSVNGEKLCLAGIGVDGVLTAIVNWAGRQGEGSFFLEVGGLISQTKEHVHWISQKPLSVGDNIQVKIIETDATDNPIKKYRLDPTS
jgi:hypothetical protein